MTDAPTRRDDAARSAVQAGSAAADGAGDFLPDPDAADGGIEGLRAAIDAVDEGLLVLLGRRRELSDGVVKLKIAEGAPVRDTGREHAAISARVARGRELGMDPRFVTRLFHEIVEDSLRLQHRRLQERLEEASGRRAPVVTVAFHGINGSYCRAAGERFFASEPRRAVFRGFDTFGRCVEAVESGACDRAVLPVENTTGGALGEVFDLLVRSKLHVVGEEKLRVEHCLVGLPGADSSSLATLYVSPLAFSDCRTFVEGLGVSDGRPKVRYLADSAVAAAAVKDGGDVNAAAIAGEHAAETFGLTVLARDVCDRPDNTVRYLVVAREPVAVDPRVPAKTSLVIGTDQNAGALVDALTAFKERGVPLTRLESRPVPGRPWEEMFYLDFSGNRDDADVRELLSDLSRRTSFVRVLGTYPSGDLARVDVAPRPAVGPLPRGGSPVPKAAEAGDAQEPPTEDGRRRTPPTARPLLSPGGGVPTSVVGFGAAPVGGDAFTLFAGPSDVTGAAEVLSSARRAGAAGAGVLFSPFAGGAVPAYGKAAAPFGSAPAVSEEEALGLVAAAAAEFGLPVVVDVHSPSALAAAAGRGVAVRVTDSALADRDFLAALGRAAVPVVVSRGRGGTADDLLDAAEALLAAGNARVVLCEGGFAGARTSPDPASVPYLRRHARLPVVVDVYSGMTDPAAVPPVAAAARAAGAHGVLVTCRDAEEDLVTPRGAVLGRGSFAALASGLLSPGFRGAGAGKAR